MTPELEKELDDMVSEAQCSVCKGLIVEKSKQIKAKINSLSRDDKVYWCAKNWEKIVRDMKYCSCEKTK